MSEADKITALVVRLSKRLLARQLAFSTAESCTGGWIAKVCTDVAGSSRWFEGGVVAYSNSLKRKALGVRAETLDSHGAVSEAVVREMAAGALTNLGTDLAVAVSGIAGPDGGSADKPVGTVWFAWAKKISNTTEVRAAHRLFDGDRDAVRRASVVVALEGALEFLDD